MITLEVTLRDTTTGKSVVYPDTWENDDFRELANFIWSEGNYSCDCNRSLFMYGDTGLRRACGFETIVIDRVVVRETGEVLAARQAGQTANEDAAWEGPTREEAT